MKRLFATLGLCLSASTALAALPQPDLILRVHFAGSQKIFASTNVSSFTNEFCSAEARTLRAQTADKLSGWFSGWLQTNLNVTVTGGPAKLRPLFDDLQTAEWVLEARAGANGRPEAAIAIKLDPARARLWQANLGAFFPAATFNSQGGWLVFDSAPDAMGLGNRVAQSLSTLPNDWFDVDINWPRLAQWHPELKDLGLPETQFTVTAPDANFRINGKFYFPENLALNLEPWRVPTNTLHQPFVSFTAIRGFGSWFQSQNWAQRYQIAPVPNQVFFWGLQSMAFQTFAAMPVSDPTRALSQIYARLAPIFSEANASDYFVSSIVLSLTNNDITFSDMPFIVPHLRSLTEPSGQFLFLEPFPNTARSKPLPPQLFVRLQTGNIVFYHWEITAERLPECLQLGQFLLLMTRHKQLDGQSAAFKWMKRSGATLGNTDTEITQSGPAEMDFTRKAPGVFTAAELFALASWLDAPNFPGCDLSTPPLSPRFKQLRQEREERRHRTNSVPTAVPAH